MISLRLARSLALLSCSVGVASLFVGIPASTAGGESTGPLEPVAGLPTHCRGQESRVFNCVLDGPKELVLSVCASEPLGDKQGYLQYRFGPAGQVDLRYPEDPAGSYEAFEYTRYTRPRVTYLRLRFRVENHDYVVIQDSADEGSHDGVRVTMPNGGKTSFRCRGSAEGSLMKLENHVPNRDWTEVEM